jgi:hypothetical protein
LFDLIGKLGLKTVDGSGTAVLTAVGALVVVGDTDHGVDTTAVDPDVFGGTVTGVFGFEEDVLGVTDFIDASGEDTNIGVFEDVHIGAPHFHGGESGTSFGLETGVTETSCAHFVKIFFFLS